MLRTDDLALPDSAHPSPSPIFPLASPCSPSSSPSAALCYIRLCGHPRDACSAEILQNNPRRDRASDGAARIRCQEARPAHRDQTDEPLSARLLAREFDGSRSPCGCECGSARTMEPVMSLETALCHSPCRFSRAPLPFAGILPIGGEEGQGVRSMKPMGSVESETSTGDRRDANDHCSYGLRVTVF